MAKAAFPGPISKKMIHELSRYVVSQPYPFVLDLATSTGMRLGTVDGQLVFDWGSFFASRLIGYNHPGLSEPAYVRRLTLAANLKTANPEFLTPECLAYYRLLHQLAPKCMRNPKLEVYTVNSGAEAVENMMKYFINLHQQKMVRTGRAPGTRRFVYFDQAYHGRTIFALNVTRIAHDPVMTKDFEGFVPGNIQVPFPAVDSGATKKQNRDRTRQSLDILREVLRRYSDEIVGIIVEPIQGAGGHRVAEPEFFRGLSKLAREFDVALGFDEVQTAGGPTGTFFAIDQFDLPYAPQAVAAAKKLGNGVVYMFKPMIDRGVLDSTWGGTLADMVRFVQEMKIVKREKLLEQVPAKSRRLRLMLERLVKKYPKLAHNVRGLGLYQGFSLRTPALKTALQRLALEGESMFLLGAGTETIRLRPHLSVTNADIDLLGVKLDRCFKSLARQSRSLLVRYQT